MFLKLFVEILPFIQKQNFSPSSKTEERKLRWAKRKRTYTTGAGHISVFASPHTDLYGFAVPVRTRRTRTGLELAPVIESRRALFDVLRWLLASVHNAPRAHPALPCLD